MSHGDSSLEVLPIQAIQWVVVFQMQVQFIVLWSVVVRLNSCQTPPISVDGELPLPMTKL